MIFLVADEFIRHSGKRRSLNIVEAHADKILDIRRRSCSQNGKRKKLDLGLLTKFD